MAPIQDNHVEYKTICREQVAAIKHLWRQLNRVHHERSVHFKSHFAAFTFEKRMQGLLQKERVIIHCAVTNGQIIGYCLTSMDDRSGEIDSLFVAEDARKTGIGRKLMELALQWLEEQGAERITVAVSHGNEDVLPFYEKHGFRQRYTVMSKDAA